MNQSLLDSRTLLIVAVSVVLFFGLRLLVMTVLLTLAKRGRPLRCPHCLTVLRRTPCLTLTMCSQCGRVYEVEHR